MSPTTVIAPLTFAIHVVYAELTKLGIIIWQYIQHVRCKLMNSSTYMIQVLHDTEMKLEFDCRPRMPYFKAYRHAHDE